MLVRDVDLQSVAGPRLRRLSADTHESGQLAVFDGGFTSSTSTRSTARSR